MHGARAGRCVRVLVAMLIVLPGCLVPAGLDGPFHAAPILIGSQAEDVDGVWRVEAAESRLAIDGALHVCLPISVDGDVDECLHPESFEPVWKADAMGSHGHWAELDADQGFQYIAFQLAGRTLTAGEGGDLTWYGVPASYTVLAADPETAEIAVVLPLPEVDVDNVYRFTLAADSPWPVRFELETFRILSSKGGWHGGTHGHEAPPSPDGPDWAAMVDALVPAERYPAGGACPDGQPSWHDVLATWSAQQPDAWAAAAGARPFSASITFPDDRADPRLATVHRFALSLADGTDTWTFRATRTDDALGLRWESEVSEGDLEEVLDLPPTVVGFCDLWRAIDDRADAVPSISVRHFPTPLPEAALLPESSWGLGSHRVVMAGGGIEFSATLGTLRDG